MASVEERFGDLVEKHLGISDRTLLDAEVSQLGVNSMDAVNFLNTVNKEFGAEISAEDAAGLSSLRDLIKLLGG